MPLSRVAAAALLLIGSAAAAAAADLTNQDVIRAKTMVPRSEYKGHGQTELSSVLNGHLQRSEFGRTKACEAWSPAELEEFMATINEHRSPELQEIYQMAEDRRELVLNTTAQYKAHWAELNAVVDAHPQLLRHHRETHCREAVMWWTHHLSEAKRRMLRETTDVTVPLLPVGEKQPCEGTDAATEQFCVHREQPNSCDWCHSTEKRHEAGEPGTTPPNALNFTNGPDDGNPHGWDRYRRCDQDQMPRCQLCEGVGGHAYGDKPDQYDPVTCAIVATPEQVNMSTVHWPIYPKQFTVSTIQDGSPKGRPGYSDTLIGWKTDPFCFSFFPQNDSIPPLCYRSQDSTGKWYDIGRESTRTDYNVKLTGAFSIFPNITASIMQVDWQMWIINHLWVVDQCVCANPSGEHCTDPPCYSYTWHYDTFKTAQYLGREEIGVEWIRNAGVGKYAKNMTLDHFIMWSHHAWTDPVSGRILRMWKPFNGLQNYDPEAWTDSIDDPDTVFFSPPLKCKKGGAKVRIHCNDDGTFNGTAPPQGLEHMEALMSVAKDAKEDHTLEMLEAQYRAVLETLRA